MQKWLPITPPLPPPPHWTLNEDSIVKRLCFNVTVKLYARAKWMDSAAATDISTSCAVETDSVGVGSLECVGAQYHTICIDNITSFILDPTPPPPPSLKVFTSPRPQYRVFCLFFIFFSSRRKSLFFATVIPRFAVTRLIRTPHGQFALSLGKESPDIFSKFYPLNTDTPLKRTPSMAPEVSVLTGFDCTTFRFLLEVVLRFILERAIKRYLD